VQSACRLEKQRNSIAAIPCLLLMAVSFIIPVRLQTALLKRCILPKIEEGDVTR